MSCDVCQDMLEVDAVITLPRAPRGAPAPRGPRAPKAHGPVHIEECRDVV
jgi:hypothetical protein